MITIEQLVSNAVFTHSQYVSQISKIIARQAGYPEEEIIIIGQAALLHDVGKSDVPFGILNKPGALTPGEYDIVKKHAENGYQQIMETIKILMIAASVAKEHHERLDGSGYFSISGDNINPYARLISVADVFDALISRRVYKESWDINSTINYLTAHENYFDYAVVGCLVSVIDQVLSIYK